MERTLDLYTWHTPNGKKPGILLAELGVPYNLHRVDISQGEQKRPEYLELNPNGKIPTLVDRSAQLGRVVVFESGAILQYLAEKYRRFLPPQLGGRRAEVLSWLYWQVGGPGPFFGQLHSFGNESPRDDHAFKHFWDEANRLVDVLDRRLIDRAFICEEYSIADIANYTWFDAMSEEFPDLLEGADHVRRWLDRVAARPAVRAGCHFEQIRNAA